MNKDATRRDTAGLVRSITHSTVTQVDTKVMPYVGSHLLGRTEGTTPPGQTPKIYLMAN